MSALKDIWREYKWELVVLFSIILIAALSFGLGYAMAREGSRAPILIEKNSDI